MNDAERTVLLLQKLKEKIWILNVSRRCGKITQACVLNSSYQVRSIITFAMISQDLMILNDNIETTMKYCHSGS